MFQFNNHLGLKRFFYIPSSTKNTTLKAIFPPKTTCSLKPPYKHLSPSISTITTHYLHTIKLHSLNNHAIIVLLHCIPISGRHRHGDSDRCYTVASSDWSHAHVQQRQMRGKNAPRFEEVASEHLVIWWPRGPRSIGPLDFGKFLGTAEEWWW